MHDVEVPAVFSGKLARVIRQEMVFELERFERHAPAIEDVIAGWLGEGRNVVMKLQFEVIEFVRCGFAAKGDERALGRREHRDFERVEKFVPALGETFGFVDLLAQLLDMFDRLDVVSSKCEHFHIPYSVQSNSLGL